MNELQKAVLKMPPKYSFIDPAIHFIVSYAQNLGAGVEKLDNLRWISQVTLSMLMESNAEGRSEESIGLSLSEEEGKLLIELSNRGVPIPIHYQTQFQASFREASSKMEKVSIENLGSQGQKIAIEMNLGRGAISKASPPLEAYVSANPSDSEYEIRVIRPNEETALSELFYHVYGYDYINEFVYYPEKIKEMHAEGKLISIVAAGSSGKLLGHVGLLRWNERPRVFEPCLGVVDPRMKSKGLFGTLFKHAMQIVNETKMQYCFFDCVTNIDFSQRMVSRFGSCDLSLFIGSQSRKTQAKLEKLGLGEDPKEMDRYSILYSVIPRVEYPFGSICSLPNVLGESLGFLLKPINLSWNPTPRFETLPSGGEFHTSFHPTQNSVTFDLIQPGREAVERIVAEWKRLLRDGYQYAAVDVSLEHRGLSNLRDLLSESGFFIAGFVPYALSERLGFRFQSIGPTKVAFDSIKVYSDSGKRLLELVKADYHRNRLI